MASVKAIDVNTDHGAVAAAAWLASCILATRTRIGWGAIAAMAFTFWATADGPMASNHAVLIGWIALILAAGVEVDRLLWTQTLAVYGFAVLNKMNTDYVDGFLLWKRAPWLPFESFFATAGIALELWLCWAVWRRHRWALPVAVLLHTGIVVVMGRTVYEWILLASFNGLMVLLVWWTTRHAASERAAAMSASSAAPG